MGNKKETNHKQLRNIVVELLGDLSSQGISTGHMKRAGELVDEYDKLKNLSEISDDLSKLTLEEWSAPFENYLQKFEKSKKNKLKKKTTKKRKLK